jgi:hypothetical protein
MRSQTFLVIVAILTLISVIIPAMIRQGRAIMVELNKEN